MGQGNKVNPVRDNRADKIRGGLWDSLKLICMCSLSIGSQK